mmetsp:Transcript_42423/g.102131  ORF Transcript_42423/g.102131 Transcript_42423/m.102131 type:complete len:242 (+) Transcript_42423:684-1409(+)
MLLSIGLGLLADAFQHVTDQALHLGEHIVGSTAHSGRVDLRCEQRDGHVPSGLANGAQAAHHLIDGPGLGGRLHLHQSIGLGRRAASHLGDHALGLAKRLQLFRAALHAGLVVRSGLHAVKLQMAQGVLVGGCVLLVLLKILRSRCQRLLIRRQRLPGTADLLVLSLQLVVQGLLEHIEMEPGLGLILRALAALGLCLLQQILQCVQHGLEATAAVAGLLHFLPVLGVFLLLHEGLQLTLA